MMDSVANAAQSAKDTVQQVTFFFAKLGLSLQCLIHWFLNA